MPTPRRLAVSYSRFSNAKQAGGDSEDRQEAMFFGFCQRHSLTPVKEVFADRGRSGYHDEHRKRGRLGQLIAAAKDGRFEPGTVVVVEAWDRLGRLRPDRQTELVAELLRTGVSIGVCRLDDIFTEDDFGTHKWTTLAVFIQLAYQESKQKAERVSAAWQKRRDRARATGEVFSTRLPAWLERVRGEVRLNPERAAVVLRIFQLAADGFGHTRIVKTLTEEKVPPFGEAIVRKGRRRSQFSGNWTRPYVTLILNDRRAVGEMQPMKGGQPDGAPLAGHYPAAVPEGLFLLARAGQGRRLNYLTGRESVPRQSKYVNAFRGLLRHARDGEGFVLHNKGTEANPQLILVNARGNGGRGKCYCLSFPVFEEAILSCLKEVSPADILPRESATASRVDGLRARLADVRRQIEQLSADLKTGYSKALAGVLRGQEAREVEIANELQEELARSARPAAQHWAELPSLADALKGAADPNAVRCKLGAVLRAVVDEVWMLTVRRGRITLAGVQVRFTGGACRNYLIMSRQAANHYAGGWWVRSFVEAGAEKGPLDLRRPVHARRLEEALLKLDLNT